MTITNLVCAPGFMTIPGTQNETARAAGDVEDFSARFRETLPIIQDMV